MAQCRHRLIRLLLPCLLLILAAGHAFGEEQPVEEAVDTVAASEPESDDIPVATTNYASLSSGYRFVSPDGPGAAADPYGRLKSGTLFGLEAGTVGKDLKLTLDGQFLHQDDYLAEMLLDYGGLVRLNAVGSTLWHNLLRERINPSVLGVIEQDTGRIYGVRSTQTEANSRIKLGNNPLHLNLGYWQLSREGVEQIRFSDHYWGGTGNIITAARSVDSITREGKLGLDAHLGPVDLDYSLQVRDFSSHAPDQSYNYANNAFGALIPGSHIHDAIPDSRVTTNTIRLHSDLSGGLIATAAYSLTQRENNGGHGEAQPSRRPQDQIQSVAGDISYTASTRHSVTLKYRHQEIDRDSPATVTYPYAQVAPGAGVYTATQGVLLVRPGTNLVKDILTLSAIFHPYPKMIYRLEYSAELEERENVPNRQSAADSTTDLHTDRRQTHTGTVSLYWRPANGVKVNGSYSYAACDNPAYGASFGDRHIGKLLLTYTRSGKWGVTGSYIGRYESGSMQAWTVPAANLTTPEIPTIVSMPRSSNNNSINAGIWFSPLERLTISANYSFLLTEADQISLLTNLSSNALVATNYRSSAHVYGIDAVYALAEKLDLSLAFQQVFAKADYDVAAGQFNVNNSGVITTYSSAGIGDYSRLDSTETGLAARADWRFSPVLGCGVDYSYRYYRSGDAGYNGSIHTTMINLKARW